MSSHEPVLPPWIEGEVCGYCPSLRFAAGEFDVAARPDPAWPWRPGEGRRIDAESGVGVCVHPHKVRLPVGRWGSERRAPDLSAWRAPEPDVAPPRDPDPARPAEPVTPSQGLRRLLRGTRPTPREPRRDERRPAAERRAPSVPGLVLPGVPADADRLVPWLRDVLSRAEPERFADILDAAERAAAATHPPETIVAALRDAISQGASWSSAGD
ncbi:hypothetical protein [Embleya sp. NPDC001921]